MNDMFLPLILSTLGLFLLVKDNKAEKPFKLTLKIEPQAPILVGLGLLGVSLISLIGNFYIMFFLVFGFLYFNDFGGKTKKNFRYKFSVTYNSCIFKKCGRLY